MNGDGNIKRMSQGLKVNQAVQASYYQKVNHEWQASYLLQVNHKIKASHEL